MSDTVDSATFQDGTSAFEEFLELWRTYAYRLSASTVMRMAKGEIDMFRAGLRPVISLGKRSDLSPYGYEEGCSEMILGKIAGAVADAPITVENQGLFFQPTLPIGPFPYGSNLTYYFEYFLHPNREYPALPILGYALPNLLRLHAGGAPDSICLCLTPTPYLYIQEETPLHIPFQTSPGSYIGLGLRKVPFSTLIDPPNLKVVGGLPAPDFVYCVFVTLNGRLIFSTLSPTYPVEMQPFVNIPSSCGVDDWLLSGSPNYPFYFNLKRYIDEQETLPMRRRRQFDYSNSFFPSSTKPRIIDNKKPSKAGGDVAIAPETSSSATAGQNASAAASPPPSTSNALLKPDQRMSYVPLAKHRVILTLADLLLFPDITLHAFCYYELNALDNVIPGYRPWGVISKATLHSSLVLTSVMEDPKITVQKLSEHAQGLGMQTLLPPMVEWTRDRRELRRIFEHAAHMSCSHLLALDMADVLQDPAQYDLKTTFIPLEMQMRMKLLVLLPGQHYTEVLRTMPRLANWNIGQLESAYAEYQRKLRLGLHVDWKASRERSFWLSLLRPITVMCGLPKWKFSFEADDIPSYSEYLVEKLAHSPGARKKIILFNATAFIHLPLSLVPIRFRNDENDLLPLFNDCMAGLYEARKVVRSRYSSYQAELQKFCYALSQIIAAREILSEKFEDSGLKSEKERAELESKTTKAEIQFPEIWGLQDYGTEAQPPSLHDIAASLLWLFGDVPEITDTIGIQLPAQPLLGRMKSWFTSLIWEKTPPNM